MKSGRTVHSAWTSPRDSPLARTAWISSSPGARPSARSPGSDVSQQAQRKRSGPGQRGGAGAFCDDQGAKTIQGTTLAWNMPQGQGRRTGSDLTDVRGRSLKTGFVFVWLPSWASAFFFGKTMRALLMGLKSEPNIIRFSFECVFFIGMGNLFLVELTAQEALFGGFRISSPFRCPWHVQKTTKS